MAIDKLAVLETGFPEDAALMETDFFENLHQCRVIRFASCSQFE